MNEDLVAAKRRDDGGVGAANPIDSARHQSPAELVRDLPVGRNGRLVRQVQARLDVLDGDGRGGSGLIAEAMPRLQGRGIRDDLRIGRLPGRRGV